MRNNLGALDKTIRISVIITILVLVFNRIILEPFSVFFFLFAIFLLSTCMKGNCPLYRILGINTNKNLNDKARIYERNQTLLKNYLKNYHEGYSGIEKDFK